MFACFLTCLRTFAHRQSLTAENSSNNNASSGSETNLPPMFPKLIAPDDSKPSPPGIHFISNYSYGVTAYNETYPILIRIVDYNTGEDIKVELIDSIGASSVHNFTTSTEFNSIYDLSYEINLSYTLTENFWIFVRAQDSKGLSSELNQSIIVTKRPQLKITSIDLNGPYTKGKYIDISGTVYDDSNVTIFYVFDLNESKLRKLFQELMYEGLSWPQFFQALYIFQQDGIYFPIDWVVPIICNGEEVAFTHHHVSIPDLQKNGTHTLNIYAVNSLTMTSENSYSYEFEYQA